MKLLYLVTLLFFGFTTNAGIKSLSPQAPIANAGPDQTIYLTQTSTVTLNGSGSSGDSYQWTEVSTDYKSGASISSPNSAVTTVSGLPQGVYYFQLEVTSGGSTATDVMVVRVDYDVPPANSTILTQAIWSDMAYGANLRDDITSCFSWTSNIRSKVGTDPNAFYMEKDGTLGSSIDEQNGKYYSTILDGHGCSGYGRSEIIPANAQEGHVDTAKTYVFEWKGYFPELLVTPEEIVVIMQLHGDDGLSPVFAFRPSGGNLIFSDLDHSNTKTVICSLSSLVNQTHTIRFILKEGKAGTGAFVKVELDGVQKYYRSTGQVGRTFMSDWIKGASLYDSDNTIIDPNNTTRGKKFSLVTESFKIYTRNQNQSSFPKADAGPDQTITLPENKANLSGSGSSANSSIISYNWTKISGPSSTISAVNSANTVVSDLIQGTYVFQLKVTDNNGATATNSVQITVNPPKQNSLPIASAGANQTITFPISTVNLKGTGSDTDGTITSYLWSKSNGPSGGSITSPSSASTGISNLQPGDYTFQLKVTDNAGGTGTDTVHVSVKAASNQSPTVNAGSDQNIVLPINMVNLTGKGTDNDGSIASYQWVKISGNSCTISNANSSNITVNNLTEGFYQFQLTVTDNQGATGKDTVLVSVKAADNIIPAASAGANQTITLPKDSATLTGSGNDSDGTIASYLWSKTNGPSGEIIASPSSSGTVISNLQQGEYTFQLKVTDNAGGIGTDTIHISVRAAINQPPTASAGTNLTITLPKDSVTLSGSGKDLDGNIASYTWAKISGSAVTITNASSATTNISGLQQGIYQFELKVTDDKGATGKDTVEVKVDSASNISIPPQENVAPTANAGKDQIITLPTNTITLSGNGTDIDGTIASYFWTKISGPSSFVISNVSSGSTGVTGLIEGTYQFELKVTDDKGAIGKDTVQIKVNQAVTSTPETSNVLPVVNAGTDITVILPTNSTILSGTASDSDGTIASYSWTKISGPASFSLINSSSATANVTGMVEGTYQFELKVTDDMGGIQKDTIQVSVLTQTDTSTIPKENIAPVVNAGTDQTITLPTNSVTLSGSGSDSDGTIASYLWTKVSGPVSLSFVNSSSATTNVTGLIEGTYQFELQVIDDKGAIGKDTVQIKVDSAINITPVKGNIAPTADAGSDITTVSSIKFITLSGSGNDSDGKIVSYLWTQISGPSSSAISAGNTPTIKVRNLKEGTYEFELKVTDDQGAIGKDTVRVTVALERTSTNNVTVKTTSLKVFPNPVHNATTLEVTAPQINTNIMIVISDINGKSVYKKEFVSTSTYVSQKINMSNLINGTYIISVYFDGMQQQSTKVEKL